MLVSVPVKMFYSISFEETGGVLASILGDTSIFTERKSVSSSPLVIALSWGLGYFGMPHILNKFMSIDSAKNIRKSQYLGFVWQVLALGSSVLVGLFAV